MDVSETILALSAARGKDKTICPSEVARQIWQEDWRKHMDETRKAAFALRDKGKVVITQRGNEILGEEVRGPIRIRIV